ncbi:hypothetical protein H8B09_23590 [Paenibacillus sp. PR3]|uniref:ABC transporter substrate-binding protein n=1 Tax=Paenibacillus terricola TaxID=2763503 RepID=A0ABR8N2J9_9BACL|nr:hypothetical protein [Paenibacillus terricola]MBD3921766.1 hypothetical protein [Paenibacillus terricola]
MRKVFVSLLAAVVMIVTITGCFDKNGNQERALVDNESDKPVSNNADQVVWFSDVSSWTPPSPWSTDPQTVEGAITEKTGLTFDFNIPTQDGATKLSLMLVSNEEMPDVMTITNEVLAKKLIQAGKVWGMEQFLQAYDPDSHLLQDFPEDLKQVISERDGGWYALPSHISTNDMRNLYPPSSQYYSDSLLYRRNFGIMINQSILDKLGLKLEEISTEDGLLQAYQQIKDRNLTVDGAPVIPLQVDGKTYQETTLVTLQDMFGVMPVDKNGVYRDRLLAPETRHALHFLYRSAHEGYFGVGQFTMETTAVKSELMTGRVFSFIGNTANTGLKDMDFWVSPGPILSNEGASPVMGISKEAPPGWMQTYISKTTQHPEKLAKWLSYMSSPEGMMLHNFGFEGKHYTKNEHDLVVLTEEGKQAQAGFAASGVSAFWPFANVSWHDSVFQAPMEMTGADGLVVLAVQSAFGKSKHTVTYENAPFRLPADYIQSGSKLSEDQEQINRYKESQITKIVMAKSDQAFSSLYDEMIVKLRNLGIKAIDAKINEKVQEQMDKLSIDVRGVNS